MMQNSFRQRQVAIPEEVIIRRVSKQGAIIRRDNLKIIRFISSYYCIEIFIYGCADDKATKPGIICLKISPTTSKTYTHWCPCNEHFYNSFLFIYQYPELVYLHYPE